MILIINTSTNGSAVLDETMNISSLEINTEPGAYLPKVQQMAKMLHTVLNAEIRFQWWNGDTYINGEKE